MEDVDQIPSVHTLDQEQAHALVRVDTRLVTVRTASLSTTASQTMEGVDRSRHALTLVLRRARARARVDIRLEMARTASPSTTVSQIKEDVPAMHRVHIQDQLHRDVTVRLQGTSTSTLCALQSTTAT